MRRKFMAAAAALAFPALVIAGVFASGGFASTTRASLRSPGARTRGERQIVGIPTANPHFKPSDDGDCEKGETLVKTTPSGERVNVPCQAATHHGHHRHHRRHHRHHRQQPGKRMAEATPTSEQPSTSSVATTAIATATPTVTAGRRGIVGIPPDNPHFRPSDDGDCEQGEAAIKTTASGRRANVPCHAAEHHAP